jgi:hypothetical protein
MIHVANALATGQPMETIPPMENIAELTVEVAEQGGW